MKKIILTLAFCSALAAPVQSAETMEAVGCVSNRWTALVTDCSQFYQIGIFNLSTNWIAINNASNALTVYTDVVGPATNITSRTTNTVAGPLLLSPKGTDGNDRYLFPTTPAGKVILDGSIFGQTQNDGPGTNYIGIIKRKGAQF